MKNKKTDFENYIAKHYASKGTQFTHTRIGDASLQIKGGSYIINNLDQFLNNYYNHVFVDKKFEFLTEKQNLESGPIAVDFDFRYETTIEERQHSDDDILKMIQLYFDKIKDILVFSEEVSISVYIFEKNDVNTLEKVTKDGIHMIIGINMDRNLQILLRQKVLPELNTIWDNLPLQNTWNDVIDQGIVHGTTNWQLYGSRKPGNQAYMLTSIYDVNIHENDIDIKQGDLVSFVKNMETNLKFLSVQYKTWPTFSMNSEIQDEYDIIKNSNKKSSSGIAIKKVKSFTNTMYDIDYSSINNEESLDEAIAAKIADMEEINYELKETHLFTMCLTEEMADSYNTWVRVGWALKNTSERLFLSWIKFSSKSEKFDYSMIMEFYDQWCCFNTKNHEGLTRRSIMYWAKNCDLKQYEKVREETIDFYVEKTIKEGTEFDIAEVLYNMFKDRFICISIKHNIWYEFINHRWSESDSGSSLRLVISTQLYDIYMRKSEETWEYMHKLDPTSEKWTSTQKRLSKITSLCPRLKATNFKNNIMREARELFYDKDSVFMSTLDSKNHLLCFNNGLIDFEEKCFRKGQPDDNVSLCTEIDYIKLSSTKHKKMINEINDFMEKLFPEEELRNYIWDHLSSSLIGGNRDQTFNIYNGCGSNGKSKLVELMSSCLGQYKASVPIQLITKDRIGVGNTSSEVAQLVGKRYAVMQEPTKGDKINEGIMKEITGGDPIQARALYKETITFVPQFKLVVCTNNLFNVNSNDDGTWRRIRICDFKSKFCAQPDKKDKKNPYQFKIDKDLDVKLKKWTPIFMSMLVERAYKTNGLVENCDSVMASSSQYRNNQDYFSEFINEKIKYEAGNKLGETAIKQEFDQWYKLRYNNKVPKGKDLFDYITKKYGEKVKGKWRDITIIWDTDDEEEEDEDF